MCGRSGGSGRSGSGGRSGRSGRAAEVAEAAEEAEAGETAENGRDKILKICQFFCLTNLNLGQRLQTLFTTVICEEAQ